MLDHKPTLIIVDDHPIVLEGLVKIFTKNTEFEVIANFTRGNDLLSFLRGKSVDVALIDIILPDINGMALCKEIKKIAPYTIVIGLSNHQARSAVTKMLKNGANGYILKDASIEEITNCVREALKGKIVFSSGIAEVMSKPQVRTQWTFVKLTPRENEILKLVAQGFTSLKIAEILFLSRFTVENHRKNLLQKFQAKNIAELISNATQQGLL
ncbi:DNA-binding response regulator [Sphingobacterium sp. CZ-UAM]|uniref:response regulator transcription factor n=1 Tax=Sphingobacterium sp. CZ-UAM TaxID=1933868 RepID=UPI000987A71E|nr:response regulator transcription factor [Sphingobacterium sp. CZ-UAM]OOG19676.1 DNA-binding response regulator [Sphingobacterium sp. CZ-UAM]